MRKRALILVGIAIAALIGFYVHGSFDRALSGIGLNFHECKRNGLGATFCGKELDEVRERLHGVQAKLQAIKPNAETTESTSTSTPSPPSEPPSRKVTVSPIPEGDEIATRSGKRPSGDNICRRVLGAAIKRANANLAEQDRPPLPEHLTPHSLRRTFASVLYALGEDPGVVMDEMGHTDPGLALRIYRKAMRRDEGEGTALRALVEGVQVDPSERVPTRVAA